MELSPRECRSRLSLQSLLSSVLLAFSTLASVHLCQRSKWCSSLSWNSPSRSLLLYLFIVGKLKCSKQTLFEERESCLTAFYKPPITSHHPTPPPVSTPFASDFPLFFSYSLFSFGKPWRILCLCFSVVIKQTNKQTQKTNTQYYRSGGK